MGFFDDDGTGTFLLVLLGLIALVLFACYLAAWLKRRRDLKAEQERSELEQLFTLKDPRETTLQ